MPTHQQRCRQRTGFRWIFGAWLLIVAVAAACSGEALPTATGGAPGAPEAGGTTSSASAKAALPGIYDLVGDIGGT